MYTRVSLESKQVTCGHASPARKRWRPFALAAAVLLGGAAVACGGQDAADSNDGAPSSTAETGGHGQLWIRQGEDVEQFENGETLALGGTDVEIFVSPYPPGRTANIDFYLTQGGEPVGRANVSLQYDMTVMEHGPFALLAVPTGPGHYLAPLDFVMDGEFWLNVSVDDGQAESVINMLVRSQR